MNKPALVGSALDSNSDRVQAFHALSTRFAEAAGRAGIRVVPFESRELPHFSKLPEAHQQMVLEYLNRHLELFGQLEIEGSLLTDSPKFVWRALRSLGYVPPSNIFDKIEQFDVVEIYTPDFQQLFRNLSFFEFVSITLEELCSIPITDLVTLPAQVVTLLGEWGVKIQKTEITQPFDPGIPAYQWSENKPDGQSGETKVKWMAPVRKASGEYVVLVVNQSRNI